MDAPARGCAQRAAIPSHLVPLIDRTFPSIYVIATKIRDDMIDGAYQDQLVEKAQELQDSLRDGASS